MACNKTGSKRSDVDIVSCKILKRLLKKTLNEKQLILLNKISDNKEMTLSSLLRNVSLESQIPLSTLKLNSKKLKELDIIDYGNCKKIELTESGLLVLNVLKGVKL